MAKTFNSVNTNNSLSCNEAIITRGMARQKAINCAVDATEDSTVEAYGCNTVVTGNAFVKAIDGHVSIFGGLVHASGDCKVIAAAGTVVVLGGNVEVSVPTHSTAQVLSR